MRIALCLEYPLHVRGGVSVLVETLMHELKQQGHEIVLVSPDAPNSLGDRLAGTIREHVYWNPHQPTRTSAKKLASELADAHIDLAHFHLGGTYGWGNRFPYHCPIFFLRRRGIPCLSTVHSVDYFSDYCGRQRPAWFKLLMLPLSWGGKWQQLRHVHCEIAVSQHNFRKLRQWYWPARKRIVQVYHSRMRGQSLIPTTKRDPLILNVGHIASRKGQIVLAEAFARIAARHPEWSLQLAGGDESGETVAKIRDIAERHGLTDRIQLLGERHDALELMQRAAIYVQPSFWEALGLALQEAMYCGCPVIGSRVGGIPELIQDAGLLFEPGDVGQLSEALEKLIRDEGLRQALGQRATKSIVQRGMTVEAMMKRHLQLYAAALGRN